MIDESKATTEHARQSDEREDRQDAARPKTTSSNDVTALANRQAKLRLQNTVEGEGVVGERPELGQGETFQYTSSSVIKDPVGHMHGDYTFTDEYGAEFEVSIPTFDLMFPELIH